MTDVREPESLRQAQRHETYAGNYRRAGLCSACSYQAGFGHQVGFSNVHPPCKDCAPIVAAFPLPHVNGWNALEKPEVAI